MYEDLLYYYNKNVRPIKNASESVKVKFGSSLIRIIDVVSFFLKQENILIFFKNLSCSRFQQQYKPFSFLSFTFSLQNIPQLIFKIDPNKLT